MVLARPDECFAGVLTGQYQAYMTDKARAGRDGLLLEAASETRQPGERSRPSQSSALSSAEAPLTPLARTQITLNWMIWSSVNDTSALSVSPALNSNPLSFVFNAGSRLKQLVDFGIIEMRSNPQYGLKAAAIYQCVARLPPTPILPATEREETPSAASSLRATF